jgi:hypothetical protein
MSGLATLKSMGWMPHGRGVARSSLATAATLVVLLAVPAAAGAAALPQQSGHVDLLNQANVQIQGAVAGDHAGESVAPAGDVNGDGRDDVIVGAPDNGAGAAYVVFGRPDQATVDLNSLGSAGFPITGAASGDHAGASVDGVGDMNNDGKDEVIVGATGGSGVAYVVFGKATTTAVSLASLGSQGFQISGAAGIGGEVAGAGDVNNDGTPDVIVGSPSFDPPPILKGAATGDAWVVFGKATTTAVNLASLGGGGFTIEGAATGDQAGYSVTGADVNNDGKSDLLVGARSTDNNIRTNSGSVYVVFGTNSTATVDLNSLGTAGYRIDGDAASDFTGRTVAGIGDMNGDGKAEIVTGTETGKAYVVFGESTTGTRDLNNLNSGGPTGFLISGAGAGTGSSVASAGDLNSDGKPDVLVGAPLTDNNSRTDSGSAYLVFGKAATAGVNLANITTSGEGFLIDGAQGMTPAPTGDQLGFSVGAAGDFNGDGPDDLVSGANLATRSTRNASGAAYVVYGYETAPPDTTIDSGPTGTVTTKTASLSFHGTDPSTPITFECSLDAPGSAHDQAFGACSSPKSYTAGDIVDDGQYTFTVRAIDRFGNVDGSPATRTWTVDTTGPTVQINSGPSGTTSSKSATFNFSTSPSEGSYFLCSLDAPGTANDQAEGFCDTATGTSGSQAYSAQDFPTDGQYTFKVRGFDSLFNPGPFATRTWTIDTTGPVITIDSGPVGIVNQKSATFTFHSNEPSQLFACVLDPPGPNNDQATACGSATTGSKSYTSADLPLDGGYRFSVYGIDSVGNLSAGSGVGSRTWSIDTTPPTTQIITGPTGSVISDTARFTFSSEPYSSFKCKLDGQAFAPCSTPKLYSGLAVGQYTFSVKATDLAGNQGAPATRSWTVKAPKPGACANTISGTAGADTLQGSAAGERILGGLGDDLITAEGGADCVYGGGGVDEIEANSGRDKVIGGDGADLISGGGGNDLVDGGAGSDTLMGDGGVDTYRGGSGNDKIYSVDGLAEQVDCGKGNDTAHADRSDVLSGCEHVSRHA